MEKKAITLSQSLEDYFLFANARRLGPNTLAQYDWAIGKLERHIYADPVFASITQTELQALNNSPDTLSKKSVLHGHVALSAQSAMPSATPPQRPLHFPRRQS